MKKLITIILFSTYFCSFGQDRPLIGFDANAIPGKRYYSTMMYYQYPLYPANDSTVALDTIYSWNVARLLDTSGQINYIPLMYENVGYNKSSVMKFRSAFFITYQDSVWNGDTVYIASNSVGLGVNALYNNKGIYVTALGSEGARYNTGNYVTSAGWGSLRNSTGNYNVATGHLSGGYNTGSSNTFYGFYNGFQNTGSSVSSYGFYGASQNSTSFLSAIGSYAAQYSKDADYLAAMGYAVAQFDVGANNTAIGAYALQYNNSADRTAIGWRSGNDNFVAASVKSFTAASVLDSNIIIVAHGFGAVSSYINLRYNFISGTPLVGMTDGGMYQFRIQSADTLVRSSGDTMTAVSGSFTLSIDTDKSKATAIGYRAWNSKANQTSIGNPLYNTEVRLYGNALMDSIQLTTGAGAGKILTSDANGRGTWQTSSSPTIDTTTANTGLTTLYQNGLKLNAASPTYTGLLTGTGTTQTGSSTTGTAIINQTLNTTGLVDVVKVDITNTASHAGSTLLALKVAGGNVYQFRATGYFGIGQGSAAIFPADPASPNALLLSSGSIRIASQNTAVGHDFIIRNNAVTATTQTSGANGQMILTTGYSPASGTGTWAAITMNGTLNQIGSGITRGVWVNNTLTAVADFRGVDITPSSATAYGIYQSGALTRNYLIGNTGIGATPVTDKLEVTGNIAMMTAGNKLKIATGSNASVGTGTLVTGTVTINTTAVTASSIILITPQETGTYNGRLRVSARVAATSFTVTSSDGADTVVFGYQIIN